MNRMGRFHGAGLGAIDRAGDDGGPERDVTDLTQDQILHDVLNRYSHYRAKKSLR